MKVDKDSPEHREAFLWNYDIVTGKSWMFGGKGDCGPLHDVWTLDAKTLKWEVVEDAQCRYILRSLHIQAALTLMESL